MALGARFGVRRIYKFTRANRGVVTMLLSLDRQPDDGAFEAGRAADLPLAWTEEPHGQGRVFYTALGHREDVLAESALSAACPRWSPLGARSAAAAA